MCNVVRRSPEFVLSRRPVRGRNLVWLNAKERLMFVAELDNLLKE